MPISIHALRGEGDASVKPSCIIAWLFLSTPSVGRATINTSKVEYIEFTDFYPRPPWGGRPKKASLFLWVSKISIHALRGEGDGPSSRVALHTGIFLSTPSVGRATAVSVDGIVWLRNFYPRPPWGGRPKRLRRYRKSNVFLSTPSVGRATQKECAAKIGLSISIHALRGEGDRQAGEGHTSIDNFYPRPPWGGRHRRPG